MSIVLTPEKIKELLCDSGRKLADLTVSMTFDNPSLLNPLFEVALEDINPFSQRASHVISIFGSKYPGLIKSHMPLIIRNLIMIKSEGVRRNFLKTIIDVPYKLTKKEESALLNICFEFLLSENSIAVKVYSMDILYNLTVEYRELQLELYHTIETVIIEAGPGLKSRGTQIMSSIKKNLKTNYPAESDEGH